MHILCSPDSKYIEKERKRGIRERGKYSQHPSKTFPWCKQKDRGSIPQERISYCGIQCSLITLTSTIWVISLPPAGSVSHLRKILPLWQTDKTWRILLIHSEYIKTDSGSMISPPNHHVFLIVLYLVIAPSLSQWAWHEHSKVTSLPPTFNESWRHLCLWYILCNCPLFSCHHHCPSSQFCLLSSGIVLVAY